MRAISPEPEWLEDDWPRILSWVLDDEPMTEDDAVPAAAEHARDERGLEWARLRSDGVIATAIRRGLDLLVEQGRASRTAAGMVALVQGEEDDVEEEDEEDEEEGDEEGARGEIEPEDDDDADHEHPGVDGPSQRDDDEPAVQVIETAEPGVVDGNRSVLVLQVPGTIKGTEGWELEGLVTQLLVGALGLTASRRSPGQTWMFFLGLDRPHWRQLSTWVGFGPGVPAAVYDLAQQLLEQLGVTVNREYAHVVAHELRPIAALTDDGLELPPAHHSTVNASDLVLPQRLPRSRGRPRSAGKRPEDVGELSRVGRKRPLVSNGRTSEGRIAGCSWYNGAAGARNRWRSTTRTR